MKTKQAGGLIIAYTPVYARLVNANESAGLQHTSASWGIILFRLLCCVSHVKADTDTTRMMTNGKDEPNEPFKLIYLADSANDN